MERIVLMTGTVKLVDFSEAHVEKTFRWVQQPILREYFLMREEPVWQTHVAYWQRVLGDAGQRAFAIVHDKEHVGNCGLKSIVRNQTAELWLKNMDRHKAEIMTQFAETYGADQAVKWWAYWRIFFMSCAELWGFRDGEEWLISHYLFEQRTETQSLRVA